MALCPNCGETLPVDTSTCPLCATATLQAPSAPELPHISGYDLERRLGEGGMGAVYLALERTLGRRVAIKLISGNLTTDPQARARFEREARALATIEHANVVRVYSFGEVAGTPYLAMEYIEGETLADRIRKSGRLSVEDALQLMRQIFAALEAAWEKGIVHRDIKPSNILIDARNRVHVADFGLAKPTRTADDPILTQTGHVIGTPYYVSPEQAQGKETDFRSDIYSCGILLYEMLAGARPFEGTTPFEIVAKHIKDPLPQIRKIRSDVPGRLARLIESMTEKTPDRRPHSYEELIGAVEAILGITPARAVVATETFSTRALPTAADYRRPLIVVAILAIAAIGAALLYYKPWSKPAPPAPGAAATGDSRLTIAVAPFYGPDDDSAKEGRVMSALVERSITQHLGDDKVRVAGIDVTKDAVRSHEAARALGERLHASVVVWGEAFSLKGETEIQPYFTLIREKKAEAKKSEAPAVDGARAMEMGGGDPAAGLAEQSSAVVRVEAEKPNQIELRKMSAEGVGAMVSLLAAVHAFYDSNDPEEALKFLEQAPQTREALRLKADAFAALAVRDDASGVGGDERARRSMSSRDRAVEALQKLLAEDAGNVQARADLADNLLRLGRFAEAAAAYQTAAASGRPYTTHYGIASNGLIFVREMVRGIPTTGGMLADTAYLLEVSPADAIVRRRISLPGAVRTFKPLPNGFSLDYTTQASGDDVATVRFVDGAFDRPLPLPGNLLLRMRGVKAGWLLAQNFVDEFTGTIASQPAHPRLRLSSEKIAPETPQTLPDLERALREAARLDPTQPWHRFYLGQTLWAEGRKEEARAVWRQLESGEFGVRYLEYNWMGRFFDRLGQSDEAEKMIARGLRERRKLAQPIQWSLLIERMINVAYMRMHPADRTDAERDYRRLRQAREVSGPTEADNYAAAAWEGHFRRAGDLKRARAEADFRSLSAHDPFNFSAAPARIDYALNVFIGSAIGFFVAALVLFARAIASARKRGERGSVNAAIRFATFGAPRAWIPVILGTEIGIVVLSGVLGFAGVRWMADVFGVTILLLAVILLWAVIPVRAAIEMISWRQRIALVLSFAVVLTSAALIIREMTILGRLAALPICITDTLGHPAVVADLEKRLANTASPSVRYVTAIANQAGGNVERARKLLAEMPEDSRAKGALDALNAGKPILYPTKEEMYAAYTAGRKVREWNTLADAFGFGPQWAALLYAATGPGVLLLLPLIFVRPSGELRINGGPKTRARRVAAKIAFTLIPGTYDLVRKSFARGLLVVSLLAYCGWMAVVVEKTSSELHPPGLGTGMMLPNILSAFPLPPDRSEWDFMMAPPYAAWFWGLTALALVALLVLHAMRLKEIVTLYRDVPLDSAPTLVSAEQTA